MTLVKRTVMIAILLCAVFLTGLQHFVHDIRTSYHKWPDLNGLKGDINRHCCCHWRWPTGFNRHGFIT